MLCKTSRRGRRISTAGLLALAACISPQRLNSGSPDAGPQPIADAGSADDNRDAGTTDSERPTGEAGQPAIDSGETSGGDGGTNDSSPSSGTDATVTDAGLGNPYVYASSGFFNGNYQVLAYTFNPTDGALTPIGEPLVTTGSPSFAMVDPTRRILYVTIENVPGAVSSFTINPATGALTALNSAPSGGDGSTHVALDTTGKWIFEANYTTGSVTVLDTTANGGVGAVRTTAVQTGAQPAQTHCVRLTADNKYAFSAAKNQNVIYQYRFDATTGQLTSNTPDRVVAPAGVGPRHIEIHPNGQWVYVVSVRREICG